MTTAPAIRSLRFGTATPPGNAGSARIRFVSHGGRMPARDTTCYDVGDAVADAPVPARPEVALDFGGVRVSRLDDSVSPNPAHPGK